jgi:hypothetical protein
MAKPKKIERMEVITVFPSGTRVKFTLDYTEFAATIVRDNKARLEMWMDADNDKPYSPYYDISNVSFNFVTKKLEMVELTPVEMRKNGR